ncbi:hypothetical protein ACU635_14100 [[Actinomadura] parvosata]|uniref:hypothetical protein n=1 Tax=[Actinomadura] parvosata TaxID=1955412 RepID=UPI00406D4ACD
MKLFPPLPGKTEITDMIDAISAAHPSDPFPARRPLLWRDRTNPAEQATTTYDEWVYRFIEQRDMD